MGTPNFANRTLYHGDNLPFLRGMNSETVQLIATDPPFNKNRDFHATPDSLAAGAKFEDRWRWEDDVHQEWIDAIQDDWPAVWQVIEAAKLAAGKDMAAFLCWLGVRVLEMRRILREDGSLYLHCDATASHYLKAMLDGIFGRKNFLREIIWNYGSPSGGRSSGKLPVKAHETILLYAKARGKHVYNQQYTPYSEKYVTERFTFVDDDGRRFRTRKRDGGKVTRQYLTRVVAFRFRPPGRTSSSCTPITWSSESRRRPATRRRSRSPCTSGLSRRRATRATGCSIRSAAARRRLSPPRISGGSGLGWTSGTRRMKRC